MEESNNPRIREALLYEKLSRGRVRCTTCERFCEINLERYGFCKTRKNAGGKLFTLVYGDVASLSANPIEKKPLYHFFPGTHALTIGTWSCNFTCPWCQNWELSKSSPVEKLGTYVSPSKFMTLMRHYGCHGTSISLNEPTLLLEYALNVFELARKEGYYNTYVTNGYMSELSLNLLIEHGLNALNMDIKGGKDATKRYCGADVDVVWRNATETKKQGIHVEITTLVIPGVNDDDESFKEIARRIIGELGRDVPWHLSAYYPAYTFTAPTTPLTSLERGRGIAMDEGLNYIYLGNVPGSPYQNTYCPCCHRLLIERQVFGVKTLYLTEKNTCPGCGHTIPVVGTCFNV